MYMAAYMVAKMLNISSKLPKIKAYLFSGKSYDKERGSPITGMQWHQPVNNDALHFSSVYFCNINGNLLVAVMNIAFFLASERPFAACEKPNSSTREARSDMRSSEK